MNDTTDKQKPEKKPPVETSNITTDRAQNPFGQSSVVAAPTGASVAAIAQREIAEVQAAMVIAKKFPRDPIAAMDRILNACARPSMAEDAMYTYARGNQDVTGASIRLAEQLARDWGNIQCGVMELTRGNGVSECLAYAWDLETNFKDEKRFQVRHWRDKKDGSGYAVTSERDIYEVVANMGSRRKRACILAVIPGDVQEAAIQQCELTLKTKVDITPERIKAMLDGFTAYSVTQEMIEKKIQRRLDSILPAQMLQLRKIYASLKDGMGVASDYFENGVDAFAAPPAATRTERARAALEPKQSNHSNELSKGAQQPTAEAEKVSMPQPSETAKTELQGADVPRETTPPTPTKTPPAPTQELIPAFNGTYPEFNDTKAWSELLRSAPDKDAVVQHWKRYREFLAEHGIKEPDLTVEAMMHYRLGV